MEQIIKCPKCGFNIPVSEALTHQIKESLKADMENGIRKKEAGEEKIPEGPSEFSLWLRSRKKKCFLCNRVAESYDRYMETFFHMLKDKDFHPNSNLFSCKWCPFGPAKGNQCEYGCKPGENQIQNYRRRFG